MSRHPRVLRVDAGDFQDWLKSWRLAMRAEALSARTVEMYLDVGVLFGGWLTVQAEDVTDWEDVTKIHLREFFVWLQAGGSPCPHQLDDQAAPIPSCEGYGRSYVNNVGRGLQQFFSWFAEEEQVPNPMLGLKIPGPVKAGEKLVPVIGDDVLGELIRDAEASRDYASRRDAALLRLLACTGVRLAEITHLRVEDVDLDRREATVTGKGGKQRTVKFDNKATQALDRYIKLRKKRLTASADRMAAEAVTALWIGHRRFVPMTTSGIYQVITRRGEKLGIQLHPHMFRHTFSHRWLDAGGAEGDLMELNGWDSPQMLRHYGASARAARARRAYDRINVMGDI
jgi:integrase